MRRRRQWQPTPVLLPGKSHGQRSLVGCSPWGHKESDTTEQLHFHFLVWCTGEGNGNTLQCSCLENPRDGGAWWAAVYGVIQSQTRWRDLAAVAAVLWDCLSSEHLHKPTILAGFYSISFLAYHAILFDQPPFGSIYNEIHSANIYLMSALCQSLTAQVEQDKVLIIWKRRQKCQQITCWPVSEHGCA